MSLMSERTLGANSVTPPLPGLTLAAAIGLKRSGRLALGSWLDTFWFKQDGFPHVWTPRAEEAGLHKTTATCITLCRVALRPLFAGLEQEYTQRLLPGWCPFSVVACCIFQRQLPQHTPVPSYNVF